MNQNTSKKQPHVIIYVVYKQMKWFRRPPPPPQVEQPQKLFKVTLHHRIGNAVELNNVSPKMLSFISSNLGRDEIYVQPNVIINLRDYSMAQISE